MANHLAGDRAAIPGLEALGDQLRLEQRMEGRFVTAVAAAKPQKAVRQDAALEESVKLVLDEPRRFRASPMPGVGA